MQNPLVAIVGRPNVGKSSLFNRLTKNKTAIVDDISGVTRDRNYGEVDWNGKIFELIDTGGYVPNSEDVFEAAIREQVQIAIDEAIESLKGEICEAICPITNEIFCEQCKNKIIGVK